MLKKFSEKLRSINQEIYQDKEKKFEKDFILPITIEIADISRDIFCFTKETGKSTEDLSELSKEVSKYAKDATHKMDTFTMKMEVIEKSIKQINGMVEENSSFSNKTIKLVEEGKVQLHQTVNKIEDVATYYQQVKKHLEQLSQYSQKILSIASYMDSIATKTAMLAINANIEASRGGDSAEGFLVITNQVRSLADQSKQFSKAINETLDNIKVCIEKMVQTTGISYEQIETTRCHVIKLNTLLDEVQKNSLQLDENIKHTTEETNIIQNIVISSSEQVESLQGILENTNKQTMHMKTIVDDQKKHIHTLEQVNEQVKELSSEQLQLVMGDKVQVEMQRIAEQLCVYEGEKDQYSLQKLCKVHHAKNIYFGNSEGVFTYSNDHTTIGVNLFSFNQAFKLFYQSQEEIKIFPLARNLFTGDVTQFVGAKYKDGRTFISIGFELEGLIELYHK